jgi:DNA helicase-2/ATP-dependent DNA helicase PcrA
MNMILRLQIESQTKNAFDIAEVVVKQTQLIKDLEKEGTPEAISKVENVQELLNGIKDFITDKIEEGEDASLTSFLEDVALATDFDSKKDDQKPSVSLMTIHQSKGLEYLYVYIVGLEENLFPSAMSMNTRSELEEERRLFYVALTRAEKVAYLSYAQTRYRWGKLVDAEPSRFLEEIDDQYLNYIKSKTPERSINSFVDKSIFEDAPKGIRFQKPIQRKKMELNLNKKKEIIVPKKLKKVAFLDSKTNLFDGNIVVGNIVEHNRFGRGEVIAIEGNGPNKKAEIKFGTVGKKKLLLQFAKLKVIG